MKLNKAFTGNKRLSIASAVTIGPTLGWLHHANGDRGVVMCAALGYEALCADHAWRVLAARLADAGLPTLRFDYPGAGDSLDDTESAELRSRWRQSIADTAAWMRAKLGVREITLVGLRLGATLAAEIGGVDRVIQIAPVLKGDAYIRELRLMSRMLAASGQCPREKSASGDTIDLEGFVVDAATIAELKRIDLSALDKAPAPRVLLLTEPGARGVDAYIQRVEQLGATVDARALTNYAALAPAPAPPAPPQADFDAIVAWAREGVSALDVGTPQASPLRGAGFIEQAIRFGADDALAGILCEPEQARAIKTVIMLNTGANAHIGSGRSFVGIARTLASNGVASLRMDCLGIGESRALEGGPGSTLYRAARRADVSAAIDWLAAHGHEHVTLVGVCSGATLALFAAAADPRVEHVLLGNIQIFNDPRTDEVVEARLARAYSTTSTYVAKATDRAAWTRVLRGEVPLRQLLRIAETLARRKATTLARSLGLLSRDAREALALFEAVSKRGARCLVLHGDHDVGLEEMRALFGAEAPRLRALPGVELATVADIDHVFSTPGARTAMTEKLFALLEAQGPTKCGAASHRNDVAEPQAVICIPTFRRPHMLAATLESIVAQKTAISFAVVVVDNDKTERQGASVSRRFFDEGRLRGVVGAEDRQGNVYAINTAFDLARERFPHAAYFLMIDDDETADPAWLEEMVLAARHETADIVGGPVLPQFPEGARPDYHDHPVYWPLYTQSGTVPMIFGTGNCLISRRVFDELMAPRLDPRFNFLGGGDTEFFTRCRKAGFSFYWRQEAQIREQVTPNRTKIDWVMRRSIATGVINYRIDRLAARNAPARALLVLKNFAIVPVALHRAARILVKRRHPLSAMHPIAVALGRWLALLGLDPQPYKHT